MLAAIFSLGLVIWFVRILLAAIRSLSLSAPCALVCAVAWWPVHILVKIFPRRNCADATPALDMLAIQRRVGKMELALDTVVTFASTIGEENAVLKRRIDALEEIVTRFTAGSGLTADMLVCEGATKHAEDIKRAENNITDLQKVTVASIEAHGRLRAKTRDHATLIQSTLDSVAQISADVAAHGEQIAVVMESLQRDRRAPCAHAAGPPSGPPQQQAPSSPAPDAQHTGAQPDQPAQPPSAAGDGLTFIVSAKPGTELSQAVRSGGDAARAFVADTLRAVATSQVGVSLARALAPRRGPDGVERPWAVCFTVATTADAAQVQQVIRGQGGSEFGKAWSLRACWPRGARDRLGPLIQRAKEDGLRWRASRDYMQLQVQRDGQWVAMQAATAQK
jgi:hypothetical protein